MMMYKPSDVFQRQYLLNLNKDSNRFDNMLNVFKFLGMDNVYKWCGSTPDLFVKYSSLLNGVVYKNDNFKISPQYLACLNSHLSIIRDAYDSGLETVLITEDDIIPVKDFDVKFDKFYNEVEKIGWDLLYLAYIRLDEQKLHWDYKHFGDDLVTPTLIKARYFWSCMAYAINRKTMKYILDYYENNYPIEIDRFLVEHVQLNSDFKCYGPYPQLFAGVDNYSNNTQLNEEIFERSANFLKENDFYNPEQFPMYDIENISSVVTHRDLNSEGIWNLCTESTDKHLLISNDEIDTSSLNFKYNISKVMNQLDNDWSIIVLSTDITDWSKTLSTGDGVYIAAKDAVSNMNHYIINKKILADTDQPIFFNLGMDNIVNYFKELKDDSVIHLFPNL